MILFAVFVFYAPNFFGNPDNYIQANPLVTPTDIVPEWYLLALLRHAALDPAEADRRAGAGRRHRHPGVHSLARHLAGALLPLPSPDEAVLLGLPGGLRHPGLLRLAKRGRRRVAACPLVWAARIGTLYYFAFFWVLMPIVGLIETPKKLPASIAQSVLGESAAAAAE